MSLPTYCQTSFFPCTLQERTNIEDFESARGIGIAGSPKGHTTVAFGDTVHSGGNVPRSRGINQQMLETGFQSQEVFYARLVKGSSMERMGAKFVD